MLPRKVAESGKGLRATKLNPNQFVEIVKATVYSEDFQQEVNEYMKKTGKTDLSSKEILDLYSQFLKK